MARTPSTSDLCNAEANKAYDVLAVISANMEKINNLSNFIFDLKDWLKFNIGIYLNDYIIELETKCGELQEELEQIPSMIESTKEDIYQVTDAITDEITALENQVNNLLLHIFDKNDDVKGATCKAIDNYINSDILPPINTSMTNFQNYIKSYMESKISELTTKFYELAEKVEPDLIVRRVKLSGQTVDSSVASDFCTDIGAYGGDFSGIAKYDIFFNITGNHNSDVGLWYAGESAGNMPTFDLNTDWWKQYGEAVAFINGKDKYGQGDEAIAGYIKKGCGFRINGARVIIASYYRS